MHTRRTVTDYIEIEHVRVGKTLSVVDSPRAMERFSSYVSVVEI